MVRTATRLDRSQQNFEATTVHDSRERNLSILFSGAFARFLDEAIQILIRRREGFCGLEMLQGFVESAGARGEHAKLNMRSRVARIEIDGGAESLRCLFAAAPRRVEASERGLVRGDVVEGGQALHP